MTLDRYKTAEALGWIGGFTGFVIVLYGVYVATSGESSLGTFAVSGAWIVGGIVVALISTVVAITSREHRGAGHTSWEDPPSLDDEP